MNIFGLGLPEIIIIALVLLLFFGQKRLPGLFRSLGSSISELKRGLQDIDTDESHQNDTGTTVAADTQSSTTAQSGSAAQKKKSTNS